MLVRHGETEGNATRVLQPAATPLNALGLRQAERLAERLSNSGITQILCSDLPRARMTAEPVARRLGLALETTPLLQERNFGDLRGLAYAELGQDPFAADFEPPNGESWSVFHARVAQAFAYVAAVRAELARGDLLVVTHVSCVARCSRGTWSASSRLRCRSASTIRRSRSWMAHRRTPRA